MPLYGSTYYTDFLINCFSFISLFYVGFVLYFCVRCPLTLGNKYRCELIYILLFRTFSKTLGLILTVLMKTLGLILTVLIVESTTTC